jgi:hypothetical protein
MKHLFLIVGLLFTTSLFAQTPDETAVKATITQFFDGMRKADSTLLRYTLAPGAKLQSVDNRQGIVSVKETTFDSFAATVARSQAGDLDERLTGLTFHIDGDLATVWTLYEFIYKSKQDHCGADAFTLVRLAGEWKIQNIIDTRRPCL